MIAVCKQEQGRVEAASPAWRYSILSVGLFIGAFFSLFFFSFTNTWRNVWRSSHCLESFVVLALLSLALHTKSRPWKRRWRRSTASFACDEGLPAQKKKNISSRIYPRWGVQIVNYGKHGVHDAWMEISRFFVVVFFFACAAAVCAPLFGTSSHCPNTRELLFIGASALLPCLSTSAFLSGASRCRCHWDSPPHEVEP